MTRRQTFRASTTVVLLIGVLLPACTAKHQALVGLEDPDCDDIVPQRAVSKAKECLRAPFREVKRAPVDALLPTEPVSPADVEPITGLLPVPGTPSESAPPLSAPATDEFPTRAALKSIQLALLALSDESTEFYDQYLPRQWAPLQLFPRLTFPAIAEPGGTEQRWVFPLILDVGTESFPHQERKRQASELLTYWLRPFLDSEARARGPAVWTPIDHSQYHSLATLDPDGSLCTAALFKRAAADGDVAPVGFALRPFAALPGRYYRLRILPRVELTDTARLQLDGTLALLRSQLEQGQWPAARDEVEKQAQADNANLEALASHLALALAGASNGFRRLDEELAMLSKCFASLHSPAPADLTGCMDAFLTERDSDLPPQDLYDADPAPVWFAKSDGPVSFLVAGDLQFHPAPQDPKSFRSPTNEELVARFFEAVGSERPETGNPDFIVLVGDIGDGGASSYGNMNFALNVFGLCPPRSAYSDGVCWDWLTDKRYGPEYPRMHAMLRRVGKPVFAVPGNHDGFVGYPGIGNQLLRLVCWAGRALIPGCERANDYVPVFLKAKVPDSLVKSRLAPAWLAPAVRPRYNGLAEWNRYFGPPNVAFRYRGHAFVALNSFDLAPAERAAVGPNAVNWGGGVQARDVTWLGLMLDQLGSERTVDTPPSGAGCPTRKHQFVFMHQDPRASVAVDDHFRARVDRYGEYDTIDSTASLLTVGHLGLGHSPSFDLFVPVITPGSSLVLRALDNRTADRESRFQEEWMMRWYGWPPLSGADDVVEPYNAGPLIDMLNHNLACRSEPGVPRVHPDGVSTIFFAHDDQPIDSENWIHPDGSLMPPPLGAEWTGREYPTWWQRIGSHLVKLRTDEPPPWATDRSRDPEPWQSERMFFDPGGARNARVIRLDDVGQLSTPGAASLSHGYHLITIDDADAGPTPKRVHVTMKCELFGGKLTDQFPERCTDAAAQRGTERRLQPEVPQTEFAE